MIKRTVIASVAALALMAPLSAVAQDNTAKKVEFMSQVKTGERLATDLIGVSVQNPTGEELGDVNDLVFGDKGQVTAAVIGVGGFLGIGEKNVAIAYDRMETTTKDNETVVVLNTTKAELQAAPDFKNSDGQLLSVSKRLTDEAGETYEKAKEKASETYDKAKEKVTGTKQNNVSQ
jgi:sporulation protein YlmC with PRC-barrel domain